jgi:uncharacterized protein YjbI with pentapeptide repeats
MTTDAEVGEQRRVERLFTEEEKLALRGLMLSNTSFDRVDFSGADLAHAVFRHVSLVGCDFRGARLTLATFFCCDLREAQFDRTTLLRGSRFDGSDLSGARGLTGADKALIARAGGILPVFSLL